MIKKLVLIFLLFASSNYSWSEEFNSYPEIFPALNNSNKIIRKNVYSREFSQDTKPHGETGTKAELTVDVPIVGTTETTNTLIFADENSVNSSSQLFSMGSEELSIEDSVGYTTVYATSSWADRRRTMPVTIPEDASIISVTMYHDSGKTGDFLIGIYSDSNNTPNALLGVTSATPVTSVEEWQTFQLISPVNVTAGTKVWLAWVADIYSPVVRLQGGILGRKANANYVIDNGMPASFGESSLVYYDYSIYCTYIPDDVTPTLSVSPTSVLLDSLSGSGSTFNITSNISWNVTDDADWLDISPTSGTNDRTITVTANSTNFGLSQRTATVTISGSGVADQLVTITQKNLKTADVISYNNTNSVSATSISVVWPAPFPDNEYFLYVRAWTEETINDQSVQVSNGIYNFSRTAFGFSFNVKNPHGYYSYFAAPNTPVSTEDMIFWEDTTALIATKNELKNYWLKTEITESDTTRWGAASIGSVLSVNGRTGIVVLEADNIDDSSSVKKFTTQDDIDRLLTTSGYNTGDQDTTNIAGLKEFVENHSISNFNETDPVFSSWDKSTGILISESQITDLQNYIPYNGATQNVNLGDYLISHGNAMADNQSVTLGQVKAMVSDSLSNIIINNNGPNYAVQPLSGTTPTWNVANGLNAIITMSSSNVTINLENTVPGMCGNLTVNNGGTVQTITFTGRTIDIAPYLTHTNDAITMSGGNATDVLSWYYDGISIKVNGTLGYE